MKAINGIQTSKDDAILNNIGLINKIAVKYLDRAKQAGIEFEDLKSIGVIGLIKAYQDYDDAKGVQFSTYAVSKVFGEISNAVQASDVKEISYPANIKKVAYAITKKELTDKTAEHIAKELNITVDKAKYALEYLNSSIPVRLESENNSEKSNKNEGTLYHDLVGSYQDFTIIYVNDFLSKLTAKEKEIVIMLLEGNNQREIADKWKSSKQIVSKYNKKIKSKLHEYLSLT